MLYFTFVRQTVHSNLTKSYKTSFIENLVETIAEKRNRTSK